jgi:hypothetical protein
MKISEEGKTQRKHTGNELNDEGDEDMEYFDEDDKTEKKELPEAELSPTESSGGMISSIWTNLWKK